MHSCCNVSGCMFRLCMGCVAQEAAKHSAKKRQTNTGEVAVTTSPVKPIAITPRAEHHIQIYAD
eukprot:2439622-Karenia_brevis.AAC.1